MVVSVSLLNTIVDSMSEWYFTVLKKQIFENTGFDCSSYSDKFLKRRLEIRMNANNVKSYREYLGFLRRDPLEYRELIQALTIPITAFFRDPDVFGDFERLVLPRLVTRKRERGQRMVRVWSAGCASGEEAYSIAMLMREYLGAEIHDFIISIRGTDINDEALLKAKRGEYSYREVMKVPRTYLKKYFIDLGGGRYKVSDELKHLVRFEKHDLLSGVWRRFFDIIFCRNVLIYFSRKVHGEIHRHLYEALNDNGFLIVGKTELLYGRTREMFTPVSDRGIYQKVAT